MLWKPHDPDELFEPALTDDEWFLLRNGLLQWCGPAHCTDELAVAMGFAGARDLGDQILARLLPALDERRPLSRVDWLRVIVGVEFVFISRPFGAAWDWEVVTGLDEGESFRLIRSIQRKIGPEIAGLVGVALGTCPPRRT